MSKKEKKEEANAFGCSSQDASENLREVEHANRKIYIGDLIYLAIDVWRQAAQNAAGDTQFIRGGQPAMGGGGVRMADRRPKTSKL